MLNQIHKCDGCGKLYRPLYEMFDVILDRQFVERFGMDEYFQQAHKVFINPFPLSQYWQPMSDNYVVRFADGIRSCPYCDLIELENSEQYYIKFFKELNR